MVYSSLPLSFTSISNLYIKHCSCMAAVCTVHLIGYKVLTVGVPYSGKFSSLWDFNIIRILIFEDQYIDIADVSPGHLAFN